MIQLSAGVRFRKALVEESPLQIVGTINANHALLAKRAGYKAIYLSGGGALIVGLAEIISEYTKITVHVAQDPLTAVCRGTGIILENLEKYKDVLIVNEDELPPKK